MYRQQGQTHIPLRVNSAGMVPLIFAFSIMIFPPVFAQFVAATVDVSWIASVARFIQTWLAPTAAPYWMLVFLLVMVFSFFYTLVVFSSRTWRRTCSGRVVSSPVFVRDGRRRSTSHAC